MNEVAPSPAAAPIGCREQQIRDAAPRGSGSSLPARPGRPAGVPGARPGSASPAAAGTWQLPALSLPVPSPPAVSLLRAPKRNSAVCAPGQMLNPGRARAQGQ